uniref:DUF2428 domain-containing protein n=1 Tax=Parascaris univalens TaxID=6257 RepID=A0A915BMX3_PARUN
MGTHSRRTAFDGDIDGGKLLAQLKVELSRGSNITIEAAKLRQYALDENYSFGTRSLAAQLYVRAGGSLILSHLLPSALLCGTILEYDSTKLNSLFEWVCNDTFTNDLNVCRAILNALQRFIKTHTENISWKHLSLCLTILLRNFLSHCEKSEDIRAIETLLSLQRLCGVMAHKQFELLLSFPPTVKHKYVFLSSVIPSLSALELQTFESMLCDQLWLSQRSQPLASSTADCVLAWALASLKLSNSLFKTFLIHSLSSSRKVRRCSCARFWLSRLVTRNELLPLLNSAKDELASGVEFRPVWPLCAAEIRELTCVDYEWRWEDEEVWSRNDCLLYAWLSIFSILCRNRFERISTRMYCKSDMNMGINEMDLDLLRHCIMNGHSVIRLEAFIALSQLLDRNYDRLGSDVPLLECIKQFVSDNLNTDDCCLRKEIFSRFRREWLANGQGLLKALLAGIDSRMNSQRIFSSLSILKTSGIRRDDDIALIFPLVFHEDANVRHESVEILSSESLDSRMIGRLQEELFISLSDEEKIGRIVDFCHLLVKYLPPETILRNILEGRNRYTAGVLKCVYELLNLDRELCVQYSHLVNLCVECNEEMMCASGSTAPGMCASLVELSAKLTPHCANELHITPGQCQTLNAYYYALWASSELLTLLCKCGRLSRELAERAYDSVWNVLVRSRHKGVVDNCADCFHQMTVAFIRNQQCSALPTIFLEKTKQLFMNESVSTRNLAFCRIFYSLASNYGCEQCVYSLIAFLTSAVDPRRPRVAVRGLKTLKFLLNSSSLDLRPFHSTIFAVLLGVFRDGEWIVRSAASHCFEISQRYVLVSASFYYRARIFALVEP